MGKMYNYFMAKKKRTGEDWGEKSLSLSNPCSSSVFTGFVIPFGRHCLDYKARGRPLFILLFFFSCDTGNEVIHSVVSLLLYHRPVIHHTVSLEDACDTIQTQLSQHKVGKVVVRM